MAKREFKKISSEEFKKSFEKHQLWIESKGRKGKSADFTLVNLEGANLEGANLRGADLMAANLVGANLEGADLQDVQLQGANLTKANLQGANFKKANLDGADLKGAYLDKANFDKAILQRANLQGANLQRVNNLKNAWLQVVVLFEANLEGTDLEGANLEKANLIKTNLMKANLRGANLREANLKGANLRETDLVKADFSGAILEGVDLRNAELYDAIFSGANLSHIIIAGLDFKNADLNRIQIDKNTASLLPHKIVNLYGKTFFLLGYTGDLKKIIRSIEFPPEYHQAGISILHTFGDVLRKKYPDKQAKVRIEQEDLKVTMIIETIEGDREIIEETLNEYGLVVTGKILPEQFTDDPNLIFEIKNELNYAKARIESQRDLIQFHQTTIENLNNFLTQFIQRPSQPIEVNIPVSSSIDASIRQNINVKIAPKISSMHGNLNELKEYLQQGSKEAKSVEELQQSLEKIEKSQSKEVVAKSSAMSKLGRFLENVEKAETTAGKVIKTTKDGIDIAQKLAGHYNQIAQWCGLPTVPKPFTK